MSKWRKGIAVYEPNGSFYLFDTTEANILNTLERILHYPEDIEPKSGDPDELLLNLREWLLTKGWTFRNEILFAEPFPEELLSRIAAEEL